LLADSNKEEAEWSPPDAGPSVNNNKEDEPVTVYREAFLVTCGIFMGYSCCVVLQHKLKDQIDDNFGGLSDDQSKIFDHSATANFVGNLIFRLFHNVFFGCVSPRIRVLISLYCMIAAMILISFFFFIMESKWLFLVPICYFLCGMSIGSFESNLLSCITPLGHDTKVWAILGLPFGFNTVSIIGFALMSAGVPTIAIYLATAVMCIVGVLVFMFIIPDIPIKNNGQTLTEFVDNLKKWRNWFPLIWTNCLALMLDMFCVSFFTAWGLYIYSDKHEVPLWGKGSSTLVSHDGFFAFTNTLTFSGDFISRKVAYVIPPINALWWVLVSVVGVALAMTEIAACLPPAMFCIMWANGAIYATTTRFIDSCVPKEFNLVSLSFWLFLGDFGSVAGSNVRPAATAAECRHIHASYYCAKD